MKLALAVLALLLVASLLGACAIPAPVYIGGVGYGAGYAQHCHYHCR